MAQRFAMVARTLSSACAPRIAARRGTASLDIAAPPEGKPRDFPSEKNDMPE
jgi:hypothetical protein